MIQSMHRKGQRELFSKNQQPGDKRRIPNIFMRRVLPHTEAKNIISRILGTRNHIPHKVTQEN